MVKSSGWPSLTTALWEFSLGIEGLERLVRFEPLRRVRDCVFLVRWRWNASRLIPCPNGHRF